MLVLSKVAKQPSGFSSQSFAPAFVRTNEISCYDESPRHTSGDSMCSFTCFAILLFSPSFLLKLEY